MFFKTIFDSIKFLVSRAVLRGWRVVRLPVGLGQRVRRCDPHQEGRRRIKNDQRLLGLDTRRRSSGEIFDIIFIKSTILIWLLNLEFVSTEIIFNFNKVMLMLV